MDKQDSARAIESVEQHAVYADSAQARSLSDSSTGLHLCIVCGTADASLLPFAHSPALLLHTFACVNLLCDVHYMLQCCTSSHAVASAAQAMEAAQQAHRNKMLAKFQRRQKAADAAKDQVSKFAGYKRTCSSSEKHGDFKLPDAVLQKVVGCLAVFGADGVRGPSMAANDLANAALVSKAELQIWACRQSLPLLADVDWVLSTTERAPAHGLAMHGACRACAAASVGATAECTAKQRLTLSCCIHCTLLRHVIDMRAMASLRDTSCLLSVSMCCCR
jgi:hypothetical protein